MRVAAGIILGILVLALSSTSAQSDTILGSKLDLKERPGSPQFRRMVVLSKEVRSPETLTGDPATLGAVVTVVVSGAISSTQVIELPPGKRWRRWPSNPMLPATRWRYEDSSAAGRVTPVAKLDLRRNASGTCRIAAKLERGGIQRLRSMDVGARDRLDAAGPR